MDVGNNTVILPNSCLMRKHLAYEWFDILREIYINSLTTERCDNLKNVGGGGGGGSSSGSS